jgi:lipoprotein-anchoring transpeptidase ErfK/SrfK
MAGLVSLSAVAATDAQARSHRAAKRVVHKAQPAPQKQAKRSYGPLLAVISLRKQRISVYGREGLITQSVVSTGQPGHPTPAGVFSVIQKQRFHRSNIYSAAPMPFMQRITWSGVALHAGVVPGYPASHGCIRLTPGFATELWGMTKVGARVVIAPDDVPAHPLQTAIDLASLCPNAEITVFPWKEPPELKARTINRARAFLTRHRPA